MKNKKIIIVGDVIRSSKKFDPEKWEYFHKAIDKINMLYNNKLEVPFTIYSGDSFGAVCKDVISAIEQILKMQEIQQYYKSRYVLIEGEISYGIDKRNFLTMEGPALWKSEDELIRIKKRKLLFNSSLENDLLALSINTIMNLILTIKDDWNEQEWTVYRNYTAEARQQDIAQQMGISQQYVSKIIKQSNLWLVKDSEESLKQIIDGIYNCVH